MIIFVNTGAALLSITASLMPPLDGWSIGCAIAAGANVLVLTAYAYGTCGDAAND